MEDRLKNLGIWAELFTQHHINHLKDTPNEAAHQERVWAARQHSSFVRESVFGLVADLTPNLARKLVELEKECHAAKPEYTCRECKAAKLVEALATAFYASQVKGGAK